MAAARRGGREQSGETSGGAAAAARRPGGGGAGGGAAAEPAGGETGAERRAALEGPGEEPGGGRAGRLAARLALELALALLVAGAFAELGSRRKVFDSGDDKANYVENQLIRPLDHPSAGQWAVRIREMLADGGVIGVWEPVSLAFKLLLVEAFGLECRVFTGAAVVLHAASCALAVELCLRLRRLLDGSRRGARVGLLHAWSAALLVGVHPLRVEPLAWASGLPFEISTALALLAALCHVAHRSGPGGGPPRLLARPLGPWRLASAVLLLLACNAKAAALGVVGALGALDLVLLWELHGGGGWRALAGRALALAADDGLLAAAAVASARGAFLASSGGDPGCRFAFTLWQRWLRASYMCVLYAVQQVWPADLCVLHAVPLQDIAVGTWRFGGSAAALALAALAAPRAGPRVVGALAAYLAVLAPTLGILSEHITETAADRYCHQSCLLVGVPALAALLARLRPRPGLMAVGVVLGAAACEVTATWHYLEIWMDPKETIAQAVRASPRFYRTRYIHGMELLGAGRAREAEEQLRESLLLCPNFTNSHFGLTQALMSQGRIPQAIEAMRAGAEQAPDNHFAHLNLGHLYQREGRIDEALQSFQRAVELDPSDASSQQGLRESRAALQRRQPRQAATVAEQARGEGEMYLSIVIVSRNDDYAGKLEARFVNHVALMYFQLARRCLWDVELLIVEWNPPQGADELGALIHDGILRARAAGDPGAACGWSGDAGPAVKLVRADPKLHESLQRDGILSKAPMAEYFGKNVGIRLARGRFVLATNQDTVYSPEMVDFLAGRTLKENTFYTASLRFDTMWPKKFKAPAKYLSALMRRVANDTLLQGTDYERTPDFRPEGQAGIPEQLYRVCTSGDDGQGQLPGYYDYQAGDFVLAAKRRWIEVAGYPEVHWTFGVDSSILCKFWGRGMRTVVLTSPCVVVHQHHRVRENPNARRVVDPQEMCAALKADPLKQVHPLQRSVELWGRHALQRLEQRELLPR